MNEGNKIIEIRNYENYYCFNWIINLKCLCKECLQYKSIMSPKFIAESISDSFYLRLEKFMGENLTLKLQTGDYNFFRDQKKLRVSVRHKEKKIHYSHEYQNQTLNRIQYSNEYFVILDFINFSLIYNCDTYIPNGVLTLVIEIFRPVNVIPASIQNMTSIEKALKNLQQTEEFSDVTLIVGEQEFHVHKAILATQSSVFRAMFKNDMKEKVDNKVYIEDVSEQVMKQVLDYIYTASVEKEKFETLSNEVFVAAHRYNIEGLIDICEISMISRLNNDNAFEMLTTAEDYKLNTLKQRVLNFIVENVNDIVERDEFKNFVNSTNLSLIKEIMLGLNKSKVELLDIHFTTEK